MVDQLPVDTRVVLIYRDHLLPYSETFILAQGQSLVRYRPYYVGTSTAQALETQMLSGKRIVLSDYVQSAAPWKMAYKLGQVIAPAWRRSLKALNPCLIHAHFGFDGVLALALASTFRIPLLVTFHGYDATLTSNPADLRSGPAHVLDFINHRGRFFREWYLRQRPRLFHSAQGIIAVSDFIRQALIREGCSPEKVVTHYIGIDSEQFCPEMDILREPIILFVGRLVEKKGGSYLIQAMATVQEEMPQARLVMIGEGPLKPQLQALAGELSVAVEFLGRQPPVVVRDWMNRASVFCVPSIVATTGDAEGLGMVFLEAQAMELPVVSFASGGIPEAVAHGETGFLASEKDTSTLSKYLLQLLGDAELRSRFGTAGRQRVLTQFDLTTQTARLEMIYDQLLAANFPATS